MLLTTKLIEQYKYHNRPHLLEECLSWIDEEIRPICWRATEEWQQQECEGDLGCCETHPIADLISALEHDLCAKGYWGEQCSRNEWQEKSEVWEKRARELGYKSVADVVEETAEKVMDENG